MRFRDIVNTLVDADDAGLFDASGTPSNPKLRAAIVEARKRLDRPKVHQKHMSVGEALGRALSGHPEDEVICRHCNDSGVIETGNNDLPCEHCPKGQTAVFNTGYGQQTGEQVLRGYHPPSNTRQPPTWKKP